MLKGVKFGVIVGTSVFISVGLGATEKVDSHKGLFKATMGEKTYQIAISCFGFETFKEFTFGSDNVMYGKDTDGDNIVVRGDYMKIDMGYRVMEGINIDIKDNDKEYSNGLQLQLPKRQQYEGNTWTKTSNGIKGTTLMSKEEDGFGADKGEVIHYEVTCQ